MNQQNFYKELAFACVTMYVGYVGHGYNKKNSSKPNKPTEVVLNELVNGEVETWLEIGVAYAFTRIVVTGFLTNHWLKLGLVSFALGCFVHEGVHYKQ